MHIVTNKHIMTLDIEKSQSELPRPILWNSVESDLGCKQQNRGRMHEDQCSSAATKYGVKPHPSRAAQIFNQATTPFYSSINRILSNQ